MPQVNKKVNTLAVRLSNEERKTLDEAAAKENIPTGAWIRKVALDKATK